MNNLYYSIKYFEFRALKTPIWNFYFTVWQRKLHWSSSYYEPTRKLLASFSLQQTARTLRVFPFRNWPKCLGLPIKWYQDNQIILTRAQGFQTDPFSESKHVNISTSMSLSTFHRHYYFFLSLPWTQVRWPVFTLYSRSLPVSSLSRYVESKRTELNGNIWISHFSLWTENQSEGRVFLNLTERIFPGIYLFTLYLLLL